MNKLVLSFIMKNEAHVLNRMLNSAKSITDCIICLDTGSTDNSIEIVKKFGLDNNIPTYVYSEPFNGYDISRNKSRDCAYDVVSNLGWDMSKTWIYFFDCDEEIILNNFNKNSLALDLYMVYTHINGIKYTRNTFTKMSKRFKFVGPVHEYIQNEEPVTSNILNGLSILVHMEGHSWSGNIAEKYKTHATLLENYINNTNRDSRWVFYTAQSYYDSASTGIPDEDRERLRRSLKYYNERLERVDGFNEERFYSQYKIGEIYLKLEETWEKTMFELLKAYSLECNRGESIKLIIDYYVNLGEWQMAYLYSKFARVNFHNKVPNRVLFVDENLYRWRFLNLHCAICYFSGRKEEALLSYNELLNIVNNNPNYFNNEDLEKIKYNGQFFK